MFVLTVRLGQKGSTRSNPIYLFYQDVEADTDGSKEEGATYFKCYLGNRKIQKITKKMNGSLNGMSLIGIICAQTDANLQY
jgi:hypothetical protein